MLLLFYCVLMPMRHQPVVDQVNRLTYPVDAIHLLFLATLECCLWLPKWVGCNMVVETKGICSCSYSGWMCNLSAAETPNIICWTPSVILFLQEINKPLSGKLFTLDTSCHGESSDFSWLGSTCIHRYGFSFLLVVLAFPAIQGLTEYLTYLHEI